jgi:hypothetical protein
MAAASAAALLVYTDCPVIAHRSRTVDRYMGSAPRRASSSGISVAILAPVAIAGTFAGAAIAAAVLMIVGSATRGAGGRGERRDHRGYHRAA